MTRPAHAEEASSVSDGDAATGLPPQLTSSLALSRVEFDRASDSGSAVLKALSAGLAAARRTCGKFARQPGQSQPLAGGNACVCARAR